MGESLLQPPEALHISDDSLIKHLASRLIEEFPREELLSAEINALLQAIVNYIHAAIVSFANNDAHKHSGIGGIFTVDHFVMSDSEFGVADLLNEMVFTNGLSYTVAYSGLQEINCEVDRQIAASPQSAVFLECIGQLKLVPPSGYEIILIDPLRFSPYKPLSKTPDPELVRVLVAPKQFEA